MALVAAKCTECGAAIEVDESKEAGICRYCGTAFITEKAINNYQSTVINNYAGATIVQEDGLQKLLNAVEGHRKFKWLLNRDSRMKRLPLQKMEFPWWQSFINNNQFFIIFKKSFQKKWLMWNLFSRCFLFRNIVIFNGINHVRICDFFSM